MLQQKAKLKQQKAARKRAKKTTRAAPNCATEKKYRHLCRTKSINYNNLKNNRRKISRQ